MAHTARSHDEIPRPPLARPNVGLVGWALFGIVVAALLAYGFVHSRAPSLRLTTPGVTLDGTPGSIRTYGSIPQVFAGDTGAKVSLGALPSSSGIVGVGSLSGLAGEIAIVRGVTWVAYPEPGGGITAVKNPSKPESAAFVALADVTRWERDALDAPVPFDRLAQLIEEHARRAGIDTTRPFPLLIDGTFSNIELEVVNGAALGAEKPSEARVHETAVKRALPGGEGSLVGFYAAGGGDRLVHAGERLHLHLVLPSAALMGHVDSVQVEAGSVLRLPAVP